MKTFNYLFASAVAAIGLAAAGSASAADIRVAPVTVEPLPGAKTTNLTLINEEPRPVQVQIRVMRWRQVDGRDELTPTSDVVASPPQLTLRPQQHLLVRVVRTATTGIKGEESYRILVDEMPNPADVRPGSVNLVLRQSIPVFFTESPRKTAAVEWNVAGDGSALVARNTGDRRIRISDLTVADASGGVLFSHPGLNGYVLPGAQVRWPLDRGAGGASTGPLKLTAQSDGGPVNVSVGPATGR